MEVLLKSLIVLVVGGLAIGIGFIVGGSTTVTENYEHTCMRVTLTPTGFLVHTRWLSLTQFGEQFNNDMLLCTSYDNKNQQIDLMLRPLWDPSGRITNLPSLMQDPEGKELVIEVLRLRKNSLENNFILIEQRGRIQELVQAIQVREIYINELEKEVGID